MKNINQLGSIISEFYSLKSDKIINDYHWKINYSNLPLNIKLNTNQSLFKQNLELKKELTNQFKNNYKEAKNLVKYYIHDWGGIRTNSDETLKKYIEELPEKVIENGKKGIASWSKALTVFDYKKYAIFDARVSVSLNGLIISKIKGEKDFFPILPSRNKAIADFNKKIRIGNSINFIDSEVFYRTYLDLIKTVASEHKVGIAEIEMCLFAYAEELAQNCFKK